MDIRKCTSSSVASLSQTPKGYLSRVQSKSHFEEKAEASGSTLDSDVDIDLSEVYFLIMHFLSSGPCQKTFGQLCNELMENRLLPQRYHAWFSRSGEHSGHSNDDGVSCPLSYNKLVERNSHIEKDHLVKLLKQLFLSTASPAFHSVEKTAPTAADVPTLLGTGSFSLLECDRKKRVHSIPSYLRWPHMQADQVRGLSLRQIGGGFTKHHRAPSIQSASYVIVKPSTMVQKMQNIKKLRGHRDAVYCAIFDRSGRYAITGSDDRLVKIWSMETALCLASCRGHEGDITDLAVSSNNAVVASASNDFVIRVWRLPDGMPVSVLCGHTAAVTTIAFSPRPSAPYHLLSSSDDGTCRIWDVRFSNYAPQIYAQKPLDAVAGRSVVSSNPGPSSSNNPQSHHILCCAYNATGTYFVTGSSDTFARVWNATRVNFNDPEQTVHEMDILSGHENDVNYVQFSGCAIAPRSSTSDTLKEEKIPKFKNSWFCHDSIVTCSRDGSAIIWVPKSRKSHGKAGRWIRAYHLKVPPPPLPPQPARGGPRQRLLPTPRGVNMIVWSLDNRFVLAAIMDCRICVWNAVDGSLVHSLTGHSASSYVLDVHPFNPRIAMSAGYDGKTIIWDIWEGIPIWTYELGRFKLVDGKFSPDGTSIVLSDEVGQIYLLNTGQGDCQKDAKYDQFFLGDYRPLIRDTNGYVLDQETQLPPHKRNVQDPLCDSGMIPYPEPYQSMYQRRRLGALGMEWHPSSIKFAVGLDFNLGQDYQMPSLEDLERMIEPIPEFIDPLAWEPEIEVISDDNDSEYNVTEEYSSEAEKRNFSGNTSSDSEGSAEQVEVGYRHREGICRSKKKKHKIEDERATSSRKRSKRRNLDEHDGTVSRAKKAKKSRNGRRVSSRRSPKAKTLRPQRLAARNAFNMLSQYSETSTDEEDEYDSEEYTSETEFELHDLNNQDSNSNSHMKTVPENHLIEESSFSEGVNDVNPIEPPASQENVQKRRKLVLRLPKCQFKESKPKACHEADQFNRRSGEEELGTDRLRDLDGLRNSELSPSDALGHFSTGLSAIHDHQSEGVAPGVCSIDQSKSNKEYSGSGNAGGCGLQINNDNGDKGHSQESGENFPRKLPKFKIKFRAPSNLNSFAGSEEQTLSLSGGAATAVGSGSSKLLHPASSGTDKGKSSLEITTGEDFDGNTQGNTSHTRNYHHIGFDLSEDAVDVVRKARSSRNKTSWGADSINHSFDITRGCELAGTSKKTFNTLNPYAELSSEGGMPSRSTKIKRSDVYESDQRSTDRRRPSGKKLSWLMLVEHEENYHYIPQLGDEVAYLRQGHQEYIEFSGSRELGPFSKNRGLRAVEMCKVEELDYATVSGSGESCCKLTLRFMDRECIAFARTFKLTLPELINFPDFIIERSRYIAAVERNWSPGDKCMVWWNLDGQCRSGEWYTGHIDYLKAKSEDFPDSPWERYYVVYENDGDESHGQSPWELHDPGSDYSWVHPELDAESRDQLLLDFSRLERKKKKDYYGIERLDQVAKKLDFCNRFPVPLSPSLIQLRLENNYYRSLEAVKHDITVMLSNGESYFSRNREMLSKIKHLSNFFNRTFSGL